MRSKTGSYGFRKSVVYDSDHWDLLESLRDRAREVIGWFAKNSIPALVHGSIARGDVKPSSDIDVFISVPVSSFLVETLIPEEIIEKKIVQATPNHLVKGVYVLDGNTTVTIPLVSPKRREMEFYYFGGAISQGEMDKRVPGIDKRLMFIQPTESGHEEIPVYEIPLNHLSTVLGIDVDVIEERIRVLKRRGTVGRTGVFINRTIPSNASLDEWLRKLAKRNPLLRQ
jgi:hypothetical protein